MSNPRQKVKDLMTLALDERTPDKERVTSAFQALKMIDKYDLLSSPLDGIMDNVNNETVQAAGSIFQKLTDPDFVSSVKKVGRAISSRRRR